MKDRCKRFGSRGIYSNLRRLNLKIGLNNGNYIESKPKHGEIYAEKYNLTEK